MLPHSVFYEKKYVASGPEDTSLDRLKFVYACSCLNPRDSGSMHSTEWTREIAAHSVGCLCDGCGMVGINPYEKT